MTVEYPEAKVVQDTFNGRSIQAMQLEGFL